MLYVCGLSETAGLNVNNVKVRRPWVGNKKRL